MVVLSLVVVAAFPPIGISDGVGMGEAEKIAIHHLQRFGAPGPFRAASGYLHQFPGGSTWMLDLAAPEGSTYLAGVDGKDGRLFFVELKTGEPKTASSTSFVYPSAEAARRAVWRIIDTVRKHPVTLLYLERRTDRIWAAFQVLAGGRRLFVDSSPCFYSLELDARTGAFLSYSRPFTPPVELRRPAFDEAAAQRISRRILNLTYIPPIRRVWGEVTEIWRTKRGELVYRYSKDDPSGRLVWRFGYTVTSINPMRRRVNHLSVLVDAVDGSHRAPGLHSPEFDTRDKMVRIWQGSATDPWQSPSGPNRPSGKAGASSTAAPAGSPAGR